MEGLMFFDKKIKLFFMVFCSLVSFFISVYSDFSNKYFWAFLVFFPFFVFLDFLGDRSKVFNDVRSFSDSIYWVGFFLFILTGVLYSLSMSYFLSVGSFFLIFFLFVFVLFFSVSLFFLSKNGFSVSFGFIGFLFLSVVLYCFSFLNFLNYNFGSDVVFFKSFVVEKSTLNHKKPESVVLDFYDEDVVFNYDLWVTKDCFREIDVGDFFEIPIKKGGVDTIIIDLASIEAAQNCLTLRKQAKEVDQRTKGVRLD